MIMKSASLLAGLLVFFSNCCLSQTGSIQKLKKLNRAFLDALINKDTAALGKILADDFLLVNPGGVKRNRADNLASLQAANQQVVSIDIDSIDVRLLTSGVGLVAAWTNNVIIADGKKSALKICYQDVYVKKNKQWKAVAAHVTLPSHD